MTRLGLHPGMSDEKLCALLLEKGSLTDMQLTDAVAWAARIAAGGRLGKNERDRAMAIAAAQGLLKKTQIKKRPVGPTMNIDGYLFSTTWTRGTDKAVEILQKAKTPSGHMLVPPGKRRTG